MKQKLIPFVDAEGKSHWPIHIDPATETLYYLKSHGGRKIKFSTRCKKEQIVRAKRLANEELSKRLGTKKRARVTSLIKDELPLWEALKETEGLKETTMVNVRNAMKMIEPYWGNKFPHEINRENLSEWYAWFRVEYPGQQMENAIKYMRNFCRFLAEKVVNGSPLLPAVPRIKDPEFKNIRRARKKKKERIFTPEEFTCVYRACRDDVERVSILFMYTMATRVTETLELKFNEQIILDNDPPIYRWSDGQNKADHDGYHALHPSLIEPVKKLYEQRKLEGTSLLFPQLRNNQAPLKEQQVDWAGLRKRAGLSWHWTPHTFRHTCLSNLFNDERNPQALICILYRISLKVAMETYIKPTKAGLEKMRTAIEVSL